MGIGGFVFLGTFELVKGCLACAPGQQLQSLKPSAAYY
jgi:hypothetical protein